MTEAKRNELSGTSGSAWTWVEDRLNGNYTVFSAEPKPGMKFRVIAFSGSYYSHLTTGGAHKFTREIAEKTNNLVDAKRACESYLLNKGDES